MKRETRDKFAKRTDQTQLNAGGAVWETAPAVFADLNETFGPYKIDLTANAANHLCALWFGPDHVEERYRDALAIAWHEVADNGYSNPPYGAFVARILAKAKAEAKAGFSSDFLLPLRITRSFRAYVLRGAAEVLLADKRLVFFEGGLPRCTIDKKTGKVHADTAMFDSMIVRYKPGRHRQPKLGEYHVPKHVTKDHIARWCELHADEIEAWRREHAA